MSPPNQIYAEEWVLSHKELVIALLNVFSFRFYPLTHGGRIDRPPGSRIMDVLEATGSSSTMHFVGDSVDSTGGSCELYVTRNCTVGDYVMNSNDELHVRPGSLCAARWCAWDGTMHNIILKCATETIESPSEIDGIRRCPRNQDSGELENQLSCGERTDPFIRGEHLDIKNEEEPVDLSVRFERADLPVPPELEGPLFIHEEEPNGIGPSPLENEEIYNFDSLADADLDHWANEVEGLMDFIEERGRTRILRLSAR